jgi:hypothetical protein
MRIIGPLFSVTLRNKKGQKIFVPRECFVKCPHQKYLYSFLAQRRQIEKISSTREIIDSYMFIVQNNPSVSLKKSEKNIGKVSSLTEVHYY